MQQATATRDLREQLNDAQARAARFGRPADGGGYESGPLLVIAGAGTGKTMTLAHRVAHLIVNGVDPQRILLLTFTRRAAEEMCRRVESIAGSAGPGAGSFGGKLPWSGTFHSVGNRLLRRYAHNLGLDPGFSVLDRGDAADLLDVVRHEENLSAKDRRFPKKDTCLAIYSRTVNARLRLADVLTTHYPWCAEWEAELRALFRAYVAAKQRHQALDYDDLLLYWTHLVSDGEIAAEIGGWFDHVLVDEYQDTNTLQADILYALKPDGRGLTVVGDDAQAIYSFRAAEVENILGFPDRFEPHAEVITLEQNYRSTQHILDLANALMADSARQYAKQLHSARPHGARPDYVTVEDADVEAEFVVEAVLANREQGLDLKDQAVLFRGAHHSDRLELELVRRNIPYVKYGGLKFLEAAHVKDFLSLLKWGENLRNRIAAFRVLKLMPGIGPAAAARIFDYLDVSGFDARRLGDYLPPAAAREDWPSLVATLVALAGRAIDEPDWFDQIGLVRDWYQPHLERIYDALDTRAADLDQLEQIASRYPTRERFLTELTLDPPAAAGDQCGDPLLDEDYLTLSTVHSAKGQEWDSVFILSVSDGSFPSEFSTGRAEMIEEERRLLYVAMTRARTSLTLLAPLRYHVTRQPKDGDRHVYGARSRFITDDILSLMNRRWFGREDGNDDSLRSRTGKRIDVQSRALDMW
ncbi:MAG: ATP-dependent helicase [Woeseiaceae bacterium]|nr:ATP-dependent helicase [Woeseiaceae bacterium]